MTYFCGECSKRVEVVGDPVFWAKTDGPNYWTSIAVCSDTCRMALEKRGHRSMRAKFFGRIKEATE